MSIYLDIIRSGCIDPRLLLLEPEEAQPKEVQSEHPKKVESDHPEEVQPEHSEEVHPQQPEEVQPGQPEEVHPEQPEEVQPEQPEEVRRANTIQILIPYGKLYKCEFCGADFGQGISLKTHVFQHSSRRKRGKKRQLPYFPGAYAAYKRVW
jgi:hypothetical protein